MNSTTKATLKPMMKVSSDPEANPQAVDVIAPNPVKAVSPPVAAPVAAAVPVAIPAAPALWAAIFRDKDRANESFF